MANDRTKRPASGLKIMKTLFMFLRIFFSLSSQHGDAHGNTPLPTYFYRKESKFSEKNLLNATHAIPRSCDGPIAIVAGIVYLPIRKRADDWC